MRSPLHTLVLAASAGLCFCVVTVATYTGVIPGSSVLSLIFGLTWLWSWWGYLITRLLAPRSHPLQAACVGAMSTSVAGASYYPLQILMGTLENFQPEAFILWTVAGLVAGALTGMFAGGRNVGLPWSAASGLGMMFFSSYGLFLTAQGLVGPPEFPMSGREIIALAVTVAAHLLLCVWVTVGTLRGHGRSGTPPPRPPAPS